MTGSDVGPAPAAVPGDGLDGDAIPMAGSVRLIRVVVEPHVADVVSDRFWQLGVRAVSESTHPDGRVEVSSSVGDDDAAIARAVATFDPSWTWSVDEVDAAPADTWKQFAEPTWYRPDRVMLPAWLDASGPDCAAARSVTLVDPGNAFGLGDHPTTRSSMAMLAATLERDDGAASVLDVGCGTGVLAVLAAQDGVPIVRAIDIADAAVSATRRNAALNGVADTVVADTTPVSALDETYAVVVANILAPVLTALADDLRRVTDRTGSLIVSGLLEARHDHVLDALAPMRPVDRIVDDGWITIELHH